MQCANGGRRGVDEKKNEKLSIKKGVESEKKAGATADATRDVMTYL